MKITFSVKYINQQLAVDPNRGERVKEDNPRNDIPGNDPEELRKRLIDLGESCAELEHEHIQLKDERAALENEKTEMGTRYKSLRESYNALMAMRDEASKDRLSVEVDAGCMPGMTVVSDVMAIFSKHRILRSVFTCAM